MDDHDIMGIVRTLDTSRRKCSTATLTKSRKIYIIMSSIEHEIRGGFLRSSRAHRNQTCLV